MEFLTTFFGNHFVHAGFAAAGGALVASPIIIHLINRMRFRRVRFAAMEFLLQSQQRNRRRILIEQLLLLLLRILIIAAIVALIARMFLSSRSLSQMGQKTHHVVLLDDSGSMRDRGGETSAFEDALDVIRKLVSEGARRPNTQRFTLILLSKPDVPLFPGQDVNDDFRARLEDGLDNLNCSHQALDLSKGLDAARKYLGNLKTGQKFLHVLSDYRLDDWENEKALAGAIRGLDEDKVNVNLVKLIPERNQNLGITELSGNLQVAAVGVPLRLKVSVQNFGDKQADDVRLSLLQDGVKQPRSIRFEEPIAAAGEEKDVIEKTFDVTFDKAGPHTLKLSLESDALEQDNERYLVVNVPQRNPILIIDGNPARDAGGYIADALAADGDVTGIDALIESPDFLRKQPLERYQAIYMLNVAQLPEDAIGALEDYVAAGGGLTWYVGGAVRSTFYNEALYREGAGLFPVPLSAAQGTLTPLPTDQKQPDVQFAEHPLLFLFNLPDSPHAGQLKITRYVPVAPDWERDDNVRKDGVTTIATLRNRQPFAFEHSFGKGKVVTFLTSAAPKFDENGAPRWNNWATGPAAISYVTTQLELVRRIARNEGGENRRLVGETIDVALDPAQYSGEVEIFPPSAGGDRREAFKAVPDQSAASDGADDEGDGSESGGSSGSKSEAIKLTATYGNTDEPGVYRRRVFDLDHAPEDQLIAFNADAAESSLALATTAEMQKLIGEDVAGNIQIQEPGDRLDWIKQTQEAGHEIRRALLIALVVLILLEQALGYRLSYHPTETAAAPAPA